MLVNSVFVVVFLVAFFSLLLFEWFTLDIYINGRWKLQIGSKEQQTSHSHRFLILFLLFFWMVHTTGR